MGGDGWHFEEHARETIRAMIRVFIESIMLFLLPAVLYLAVALLTRRDETPPSMVISRAPILTLSLLGASLVFGVMMLFGKTGDGKPGQAYEPAIFKDGKVIPGHMR